MKYVWPGHKCVITGRSREGAWIEIGTWRTAALKLLGRSREGAWIEIAAWLARLPEVRVAPARERGLKC